MRIIIAAILVLSTTFVTARAGSDSPLPTRTLALPDNTDDGDGVTMLTAVIDFHNENVYATYTLASSIKCWRPNRSVWFPGWHADYRATINNLKKARIGIERDFNSLKKHVGATASTSVADAAAVANSLKPALEQTAEHLRRAMSSWNQFLFTYESEKNNQTNLDCTEQRVQVLLDSLKEPTNQAALLTESAEVANPERLLSVRYQPKRHQHAASHGNLEVTVSVPRHIRYERRGDVGKVKLVAVRSAPPQANRSEMASTKKDEVKLQLLPEPPKENSDARSAQQDPLPPIPALPPSPSDTELLTKDFLSEEEVKALSKERPRSPKELQKVAQDAIDNFLKTGTHSEDSGRFLLETEFEKDPEKFSAALVKWERLVRRMQHYVSTLSGPNFDKIIAVAKQLHKELIFDYTEKDALIRDFLDGSGGNCSGEGKLITAVLQRTGLLPNSKDPKHIFGLQRLLYHIQPVLYDKQNKTARILVGNRDAEGVYGDIFQLELLYYGYLNEKQVFGTAKGRNKLLIAKANQLEDQPSEGKGLFAAIGEWFSGLGAAIKGANRTNDNLNYGRIDGEDLNRPQDVPEKATLTWSETPTKESPNAFRNRSAGRGNSAARQTKQDPHEEEALYRIVIGSCPTDNLQCLSAEAERLSQLPEFAARLARHPNATKKFDAYRRDLSDQVEREKTLVENGEHKIGRYETAFRKLEPFLCDLRSPTGLLQQFQQNPAYLANLMAQIKNYNTVSEQFSAELQLDLQYAVSGLSKNPFTTWPTTPFASTSNAENARRAIDREKNLQKHIAEIGNFLKSAAAQFEKMANDKMKVKIDQDPLNLFPSNYEPEIAVPDLDQRNKAFLMAAELAAATSETVLQYRSLKAPKRTLTAPGLVKTHPREQLEPEAKRETLGPRASAPPPIKGRTGNPEAQSDGGKDQQTVIAEPGIRQAPKPREGFGFARNGSKAQIEDGYINPNSALRFMHTVDYLVETNDDASLSHDGQWLDGKSRAKYLQSWDDNFSYELLTSKMINEEDAIWFVTRGYRSVADQRPKFREIPLLSGPRGASDRIPFDIAELLEHYLEVLKRNRDKTLGAPAYTPQGRLGLLFADIERNYGSLEKYLKQLTRELDHNYQRMRNSE